MEDKNTMPDKVQLKEKERQAQLKALREELTREIEEQLPAELLDPEHKHTKTQSYSTDIQSEDEAKKVIEAILFTASRPVTVSDFKRVMPSLSAAQIQRLIYELKSEYEVMGRSFHIQDIAGG